MDGLGHHILAGSGLAGDQDRRIALGNDGQDAKEFFHLIALANNVSEAVGVGDFFIKFF